MDDLEFIPGQTVPLACVGKTGGEADVKEMAMLIALEAARYRDPSPCYLARAIAEAVCLVPLCEYQYRVSLRAKQVARQYGDWCGGWVDPLDVIARCLDVR